jgi:hypothetical protein
MTMASAPGARAPGAPGRSYSEIQMDMLDPARISQQVAASRRSPIVPFSKEMPQSSQSEPVGGDIIAHRFSEACQHRFGQHPPASHDEFLARRHNERRADEDCENDVRRQRDDT